MKGCRSKREPKEPATLRHLEAFSWKKTRESNYLDAQFQFWCGRSGARRSVMVVMGNKTDQFFTSRDATRQARGQGPAPVFKTEAELYDYMMGDISRFWLLQVQVTRIQEKERWFEEKRKRMEDREKRKGKK
jgi:hypothetical protein